MPLLGSPRSRQAQRATRGLGPGRHQAALHSRVVTSQVAGRDGGRVRRVELGRVESDDAVIRLRGDEWDAEMLGERRDAPIHRAGAESIAKDEPGIGLVGAERAE